MKNKTFKFALGALVKDSITDFEGMVVSRTDWLHNCHTYGVQPRALLEGKIQERGHFDELQLVLVEESTLTPKGDTGGPERPIPRTNR